MKGLSAAADRRKEVGENLRDLPEISRLGTFVYLARKGAEAQRKNPFAAWRLCAPTSFFPKGATRLNPLRPG
jgi:hypothetical protein